MSCIKGIYIEILGRIAIANPIIREVLPKVLTMTPMVSLHHIIFNTLGRK